MPRRFAKAGAIVVLTYQNLATGNKFQARKVAYDFTLQGGKDPRTGVFKFR